MNQTQIETIIRSRIAELQQFELDEHIGNKKVSYQDKRDELEAILLRIRCLAAVQVESLRTFDGQLNSTHAPNDDVSGGV
jgi:hypothetical protein